METQSFRKVSTEFRFHAVKSVQIRNFFWSVFFGIRTNTERYGISLGIQSECGKIRTRENSVFGQWIIPKLCGNCEFLKIFHNKKLSEMTVLSSVVEVFLSKAVDAQ